MTLSRTRAEFTLIRGLPDSLRDDAAALYWQAFGTKLGRVLGPKPLALAFVRRAIRSDHAIVALDPDGVLLGMAGFKTLDGSFAGGDFSDLRAVYGRWGTTWRAALLQLLHQDTDEARFLLDGVCVARPNRGQGIGTALMMAICDEATARGHDAVRLDVVDSNGRARALYERLGFAVERVQPLGIARLVFGFGATITMVRPLP